ncbi:MAG: GGDEF domain-containing protein [Candidatus Nanopelagicales bacterium]
MYHEHEVVQLTASRVPRIRAADVELAAGAVVVLLATLLLHDAAAVVPTPGSGRLGPLLVVLAAAASLVRARFGEGRTQRAVTFDATGLVLMAAALLLTPEWFPLVALAASLRADVWRTVLNTCVRTTAVCAAAVVYQSLAVPAFTSRVSPDVAEVTRLVAAGTVLIGVELFLYRRHLRASDDEADLPDGLFRAAVLRDAPAVAIGCLAAVLLALAPATTLLLVPVVGLLVRSLRDHERLLESSRDPKTSLLTYAGFRPQAAAEVARAHRHGRPASLLFVDLDGLKSVNTALGWLVGESVITTLGRVMRDQMRAEDVVARTGGDEFCLLLPDTDVAGALAFADRLRTAIETTPLADGTPPLHRTASVGLASLRAGESLESLLDRADEGLRRAKSEGRNRVVVMEPQVVRTDEERSGTDG